MDKTLLFTVGPVEMSSKIKDIGGAGIPYFRTKEFSEVMLEIENKLKKFLYTNQNSKVITLTASGSGAMEASIINIFTENDKVLIVNGGSFGDRFEKICKIHNINYNVIKLKKGESLKKEELDKYSNKGYTGLLINVHETSTGVLYDMKMVGEFCKKENILLVADAISSFLADEYKMDEWGIDVTILSSQKALALPPGLSFLIINKKVNDIIIKNSVKSLYFDLKDYLMNMERGQTPFTPAVGIIYQLYERLKEIEEVGVEKEIGIRKNLAEDFRNRIKKLPLELFAETMSNAVTAIVPKTMKANEIYEKLRYDYEMTVLPSGGDLKEKLFRVGHLGDLTIDDNEKLVDALKEILKGE
ncbi:pyridoxal-phosphate-dependent aminotransferase family protein [Haliovirga abyssi]|uniref:Serine-pyruvate aminotransferase n=1 Tax=Haliovirga abyssi TaxID=2996794 RepID=A0AAU9D7Y5_9FUSO|nr:aminotransferase class V-fold PLP-dependent enzyme [Haliovirga abyssi]BDU49686.1 serine-pyruvate aminotransferase [Haliovirga abyssi]